MSLEASEITSSGGRLRQRDRDKNVSGRPACKPCTQTQLAEHPEQHTSQLRCAVTVNMVAGAWWPLPVPWWGSDRSDRDRRAARGAQKREKEKEQENRELSFLRHLWTQFFEWEILTYKWSFSRSPFLEINIMRNPSGWK